MLDLAQNPQTLAQGLNLFFALMIGHALADYPLQGDFIALHKNRHYIDEQRVLPAGIWIHCLLAHSLIQAGFVWMISGRVIFAVVELVLHLSFDFLKCEKVTGFQTDQALHAATKAIFVIALLQGWVA